MYAEGGNPSFPFTHYDDYQAHQQSGVSGLNLEFYASSLSTWPEEYWFDHGTWTWGHELIAVDADNDGLPDYGQDGSNTELAITEASLNSSSLTTDTDGDKLSDLEEATIHFLRGSDPVNDIDSDDDGQIDGEDMYPLHDATIGILPAIPVIDGIISPDEHNLVSSIDRLPQADINSFISWDSQNMYFAFDIYTSAENIFTPTSYEIYFDFNNDGILNGDDNYGIRVGYEYVSDSRVAHVYSIKGGTYNPEADIFLDHNLIQIAYSYDDSQSRDKYELAVPLQTLFGIIPEEGLKINMLVTYNDFSDKYNLLLKETTDNNERMFSEIVLTTSDVANLEFSGTVVDFGTIDETGSVEKSVIITNFGERDLDISRVICINSSFHTNELPAKLAPRETTELIITWNPQEAGSIMSPIIIESNATNGLAQAIFCMGTAEAVSTSITIEPDFSFDGIGEYYWESEDLGSFINSWNLETLTVNGIDFTNQYVSASNLPGKINGKYSIYYKSTVDWGHFETKY